MLRAMKHLLIAATALTGAAVAAPEAGASTVAALTGDRTLLLINTSGNPRVTRTVNVGVSGRLAGIDVRASNGLLYGVTTTGQIVVIDPQNGTTTAAGNLTVALPNTPISVDINPVADAIRIVGANGLNLRHPFATGTTVTDTPLNFPSPQPFGDTTPGVVAIAYSNPIPGANVPGTTATQLFDIDTNPPAIYLQLPPNSGTLQPLARLGAALGDDSTFGFDIGLDNQNRNVPLIVSSNRLIELDILGGKAFSSRRIRGLNTEVRDIAALRD
jgi:hypothetical protein